MFRQIPLAENDTQNKERRSFWSVDFKSMALDKLRQAYNSALNWTPVKTFIDSYNAISPLVGRDKLLATLLQEVAVVTVISAMQWRFAIDLAENKRSMDKMLINGSVENEETTMPGIFGNYALHLVASNIASYAIDYFVREWAEDSLKELAQIKHNDDLYGAKGNRLFLRVSENAEKSRDLKSIPKDIGLVIRIFTSSVSSLTKVAFNGALSINYLMSAKDSSLNKEQIFNASIIAIKVLFSITANAVSHYLAAEYSRNNKEANNILAVNQKAEHHNQEHALAIAGHKADASILESLHSSNENLRNKGRIVTKLQNRMTHFNNFITALDQAIDYLLVAQSATFGGASKDGVAKKLYYLSSISSLFNWPTRSYLEALEASESSVRLNEFNQLKVSLNDFYANDGGTLHQNKLVRNFIGNNNVININNPKITVRNMSGDVVKESVILQCDSKQLSISLKDRYNEDPSRVLIMGSSGSGKSTFVKMLAGLIGGSSLNTIVEATISFPKALENKITYISQDLFIPQNLTLLKLLIFPKTQEEVAPNYVLECIEKATNFINASGRAEVFKEMIAEAESLATAIKDGKKRRNFKCADLDKSVSGAHVTKDWSKGVSGGEAKIFPIIWALCSEPKLLILDETLTGLDGTFVTAVREYFRENLKNTSIIEIFHFDENVTRDSLDKIYTEIIDFNEYNNATLATRVSQPQFFPRSNTPNSFSIGRNVSRIDAEDESSFVERLATTINNTLQEKSL